MGKRAFVERATEASEILQRVVERGWTPDEIADYVKVSKRQVYRWLHEGSAPHPLLLDGLRRLDEKVASRAG